MADIVEGGGGGGGGGRHQKKRAKKGSARIDMTPMVDLAFLLLTFFILTTTMYKPSVLQLTFPVPDPTKEKQIELSNAVTLILTKKDQILYYWGEFYLPGNEKGAPATQLERTDFSKVRSLLVEKNKVTIGKLNAIARDFNTKKLTEEEYSARRKALRENKDNLKAIIKTDKDAKYRNMIDMVDEMDISGIASYGVMDSLKVGEQALVDAIKPTL